MKSRSCFFSFFRSHSFTNSTSRSRYWRSTSEASGASPRFPINSSSSALAVLFRALCRIWFKQLHQLRQTHALAVERRFAVC